TWAEFHMGDGTAPGGERLLRRESLELMQSPLAEAGSMCDHIGVSWMLNDVDGTKTVMHGGATHGQLSSFEFVPAKRFAATVLTNADAGREMRYSVGRALRHHFLDEPLEPPLPPEHHPADLAEYAGRYVAALTELDVAARDGAVYVQPQT